MKSIALIVPVFSALILVSASAHAAKVGDPCNPKGGGAGHFVDAVAAGQHTIKCKADAKIVAKPLAEKEGRGVGKDGRDDSDPRPRK